MHSFLSLSLSTSHTHTHTHTELHKLREAEEVFEECERQGTDSSQQFLFSRGTNYLAMNASEKARVYLSRAFDMGGDDVPTRVNYGACVCVCVHCYVCD